ncbi:receptor kinase-like protein Xa21 [Arachis ipaensis]|uniref:receptor kinase-like protein Xa21 n=1 Tax=Arachis ipaensis TaxID=130454 RepID=UPI000A2B6898|nr:receptor kinase-like protein Xa21 [Arachis ipaensis]XP_025629923.1 receptor kinase-like protein Xa21 [Arachis hypogaea]QHO21214.1 putative LRR receptor-like serine/threonine-protein kinase [Arachis hypogaea]
MKMKSLLYPTLLSLLHWHVAVVSAARLNMASDESALVAMRDHFNSLDPNNVLASNWSSSTSVCNWIGVTCGSSHRRVTALNLSYMALDATIPPHLGNLSFLSHLHLPNNSFHGTLPADLAGLRRLRIINLRFNKFTGSIPSWFESLPKLKYLLLRGNSFSGTVPHFLFNMTSLQYLVLSDNQFWGPLPSNIFLSHSLQYVFLSHNQISGAIPSAIINSSLLQVIELNYNNLSGQLPERIFHHLPNLKGLYVTNNSLSGELPRSLFDCKQLQSLSLSYNTFGGNIPSAIENLTNLKEIYLGYNNFRGAIPYEIGNLRSLEILSLPFANVSGYIPPSIYNISTLRVISVTGNRLSGSLPASLGSMLPKLVGLYMGSNYLSGRIPGSLCNATMLNTIDLAFNSFSGYIPDIFGSLRSLQLLNLGKNNLTSDSSDSELSIINSLTNCRFLKELTFSGNPLDSILPISVGNLSTSLVDLNLRGCSMRGTIPASIGNLSSLIKLDLGTNNFVGTFPTSIGKLIKLQGFYLHDNQLEGFVPNQLCQLTSLDSFAVKSNKFSGPIPSCLSNLTSLRWLWLSSNEFNSIPSTLWELSNLLLLDLSSNNLSGYLPLESGNLKAISWMYLSGNQFSGSIPRSLSNLMNLALLTLARNKFEGPIPESFGRMVSLEQLDLSENNLSGVIPKTLEALVYLKYFNVSHNKLKGKIPDGGPFANFSAQSFMGNKGLCGAPRFHFSECKIEKSRKWNAHIVLTYILPAAIVATLLVAFLCILKFRKHKVVNNSEMNQSGARWRRISYYEIQQATDRFNDGNLLGVGSFGRVYKGVLSDGTNVAVKVFNLGLEGAFRSFDAECEILRSVRHRNLTKIISSCSNMDFKALILSYMPNGSLERWLHSEYHGLSMIQRLNIMIDVAEAMNYLHNGGSVPIIHCDLKPSNILLDEDMVAHVTDFGIAKLLSGDDSITQTMNLATIGYMAPEYGLEGRVSRQGDVYSYGILLMETFTQKKPTDEMFVGEFSIKEWVKMSCPDSLLDIIDAKLLVEEGETVTKQDCLLSIMTLALNYSAESPGKRTRMKDAMNALKKIKRLLLN